MKSLLTLCALALVFLMPMKGRAEVVEYVHTDALGSPVAITNEAGQVIERTDYDPYGNVIGKPNNDRPGYTGHVMDSATGLTYMQQRYMDPTIGRFLSTDPVQALGGAFNRYDYASNNPYRFIDPDGRVANDPQPSRTPDQECSEACMRMRRLSDRMSLGHPEQSTLEEALKRVNAVSIKSYFSSLSRAISYFGSVGIMLQNAYGVEIGANLMQSSAGFQVTDFHPGYRNPEAKNGEVTDWVYTAAPSGSGQRIGIIHTHPTVSNLSGSGLDYNFNDQLGDSGQSSIYKVDAYVVRSNYTVQRFNYKAWVIAGEASGKKYAVEAGKFYEEF